MIDNKIQSVDFSGKDELQGTRRDEKRARSVARNNANNCTAANDIL